MAPLSLFLFYLGGLPFLVLLLCVFALSVYEWINLSTRCPRTLWIMAAGLVYISFAFACFIIMRQSFAFAVTLLFVVMIWLSDSGAFLVGKAFGGPKLAEGISPKKTWSGFLGAVCVPALFSAGMLLLFADSTPNSAALLSIATAAVVVGAFGQLGDLSISMFKRRAGIKDTSALIPGHGGILDRLDSMLLACPVYFFFLAEGVSYAFL